MKHKSSGFKIFAEWLTASDWGVKWDGRVFFTSILLGKLSSLSFDFGII